MIPRRSAFSCAYLYSSFPHCRSRSHKSANSCVFQDGSGLYGSAADKNHFFILCLALKPWPLKKLLSSYWIRSAFFTFLQRFSLTFFGLVNFIILIRTFGNDHAKMGTWALFLIVTAIFETSKNNLIKNSHIRFFNATADEGERKAIASSSFVINVVFTLACFAFILFCVDLISGWLNAGEALSEMLRWYLPGMLFLIPFSHLETIQQAHLDFKGVFVGYFIRQFAFFTVLIVHLVTGIPLSLKLLAIYQSASILLGTAGFYFVARKYLAYVFVYSWEWIKKLIGYGRYIFGSGMMAMLFTNLDQLMIATFLKLPASVAYYNAASRINQLVDIPSYAASEIIFPKVAEASAFTGNDRVRYLYERMVGVLLSFTIPATLFIMLFPKLVIAVIAGSAYYEAALILQIYMFTGILRPVQHQAANLLNSIGKSGLCFIINTVSLAANLLINYYCLKRFGFYGAAIGTLITSILGFALWCLIMKKQIQFKWRDILRYVLETYKFIYTQAAALLQRRSQVTA
jgi:lipopolysaccharide exporter